VRIGKLCFLPGRYTPKTLAEYPRIRHSSRKTCSFISLGPGTGNLNFGYLC
jgi:hypothetical protein